MTDTVDRSALRQFLLGLAQGMNASAESVDRIRDTLTDVARAYGGDDTDFVVLPTIILVETGESDESQGRHPLGDQRLVPVRSDRRAVRPDRRSTERLQSRRSTASAG